MSGVTPEPNDVLFGRGFTIAAHPGNRRLRSIVDARRAEFKAAKKKEKRILAGRIVDEILGRTPPGRFLVEDPATAGAAAAANKGGGDEYDAGVLDPIFDKVWICETNREKCVDKVMHRLREKVKPPPPSIDAPPAPAPLSSALGTSPPATVSMEGLAPNVPQQLPGQNSPFVNPGLPQQPLPSDQNALLAGQLQQMQQLINLSMSAGGSPDQRAVYNQLAQQQLQQMLHQQQQQNMSALSGSPSPQPNVPQPNVQPLSNQQQNLQQILRDNLLGASPSPGVAMDAGQFGTSPSPGVALDAGPLGLTMEQRASPAISGAPMDVGGHSPHLHPTPSPQPLPGQPTMAASPAVSGANGWMMDAMNQSPSPQSFLGQQRQQPSFGFPPEAAAASLPGSNDSGRNMMLAAFGNSNLGFPPSASSPVTSGPTAALHGETSAPPERDDVATEILAAEPHDDLDALNDFMGSFFEDVPPEEDDPLHHRTVAPPASREVALREWIARSTPRGGGDAAVRGQDMAAYATMALPLALKLTDALLAAEGGASFVPLASIACEHVVVDGPEQVDRVAFRTGAGDDPDPGDRARRFVALGGVLYELFSRAPLDDGAKRAMGGTSGKRSVRRLSLGSANDEATDGDHRQTKRQQSSSLIKTNDALEASVALLEVMDVPHSLCALVRNLLDQGDFRSDDAYRSLADVRTDLQLMLKDPACFLDNLQVGPRPSFEVRPKFYGRDDDIVRIQRCYQQHMNGACGGMVVSGSAGVGKSSLVSQTTRRLAARTNSHFLEAKFDQSNNVFPLTIGGMFDALCDAFAREATQQQLTAVVSTLEAALGDQTALLCSVLPSLSKLLGCSPNGPSSECIDAAASMQFLFTKLLETVSQHWRLAFFLDDLQWADPASLRLIASMLSKTTENGFAFFACCYRDDDVKEGDPFTTWLSSIETFPLETVKLQNIGVEGVNGLVSETLHVLPRLTRPLSSVLHHKTRGNPLFLRQLLESLRGQGLVHLNLNPPRWTWDLDKIANLELSNNVLALLIKDMQGLPDDLQLGLRVASCLGFSSKYSCLDILSTDLCVNLRDVLDPLVQKGFMMLVDDDRIRFSHDKIRQAAYEMMPVYQRLENHMRFGLAICSHTLDESGDDDLFFTAVNQINSGGVDSLADPRQKVMIAALNLKAGRRSVELSDFSAALKLFEHGISFLNDDERWTSHYSVSLQLFDAAVETACSLNDAQTVNRLSKEVLDHTRSPDDKLKCLYAVAKSLRVAFKFQDSKKAAYTILEQLGEQLPRSSDDAGVAANVQEMKLALQNMSDQSIFDMKETNQMKRDMLLLNIYHDLNYLFQFIDQKRIADCSCRMAQITLSNGMCSMTPLALAQFAIVLVINGDIALSYRIGTLALRLIDKIDAQRYTSAAIALVGTLVSWVAEPLQSIAETHLLGHEHGQRNGDAVASALNYLFYLQISYQSGQSLSIVREKSRAFAGELLRRKQKFLLNGSWCVYLQSAALMEGLDFKDSEDEGTVSWDQMTPKAGAAHKDFPLVFYTHQYTRAFLFKQYDKVPPFDILDTISRENVPLRPIFVYGIFFQGLTCIHFARQTDADEYHRKVEAALVFMRKWSKHNHWNFGNKYKLLEAGMMHLSGYHNEASELYEESVKMAHQHKFIHEEAIASELAASFFYERGLLQKSQSFFLHSVNCYKKWGAMAVAARVENDFRGKFGPGLIHGGASDDVLRCLKPNGGSSGSSRKRRE